MKISRKFLKILAIAIVSFNINACLQESIILESKVLASYTKENSTRVNNGVIYEIYENQKDKFAKVIGVIPGFAIENLIIPEKIKIKKNFILEKEYPVRIIGERAFQDTCLSSIELPNSLERIEKCAFFGCLSLERMILKEGSKLNFLGDFVFSETSVKNIEIPSSVKSISALAFHGCGCLRCITFKGDPNIISDEAWNSTAKFLRSRHFCLLRRK